MPTSVADERTDRACLVIEGVTAGYGPVSVIHDVSVTAAPREVVCVVGPNGAGKSTLLKAVNGVIRPTAGVIAAGGTRIDGLAPERLCTLGIGYVPQVRDVFESLTVRENLEMGGYGLPRREIPKRIEEVLATFPPLAGMQKRWAEKLSGGERKMVAIGRVLMRRPSILILDEPTAGLSPKLAQQVLHQYARALADAGVAVLLVEQRAREALAISDWAYVMASGRVKFAAPAQDILGRDDIGQVFLGSVPVATQVAAHQDAGTR